MDNKMKKSKLIKESLWSKLLYDELFKLYDENGYGPQLRIPILTKLNSTFVIKQLLKSD